MQPLNRHLFDSRRLSIIETVGKLPFISFPPQLAVLRDDLNHAIVSGNKLRKLKYILQAAGKANTLGLISFGGAHSNHLHALAFASKELGLQAHLIVRGEEVLQTPSPTLVDCLNWGAKITPISRQAYKHRYQQEWQQQWLRPGFQLVPEGGSDTLAVQGVAEALDERTHMYDVIACAAGSGGTVAGLALGLQPHQRLLAFPAVKDPKLPEKVRQLMGDHASYQQIHWCWGYEWGGFGRFPKRLECFVVDWLQATQVLPDPVYTAKLFYGITDLYRQNQLKPEQKVLLYHSGGLQGWRSMATRLSAEMQAYLDWFR